MNPNILIATNGFKGTWPSIQYGVWLAATLNYRVTLLGVTEHLKPAAIDDHHPLEDVFARALELFQQNGLEYSLEVRNGNAEEVIPRKANERNFISVLGPLGRPSIRHWLVRRSIRHLMEDILGPIIYVPELRLPVRKLLIAIGGLGYEVTAEHIAIQVALSSDAEITLLHVVPPVDLDYPTARAEREGWQHPADTNTPVGRSLRQSLEIARQNGLNVSVKGRQGNIVEQILAEIREGSCDLLCMGSPYSANTFRQLYTPNVTAEVAEAAGIPILTARFKKEL